MNLERLTGQALQDEINRVDASNQLAQMQDKMINNFLNGNSMANAMNNELIEKIEEKLKPVNNFFDNPPAPAPKRISKKERERIESERSENRLRERALNYIKNGGKV